MKTFKDIFTFELKKTLSKLNIALFMLFYFLLLLIVQNAQSLYKDSLKDKNIFQETEKSRVKTYRRYSQYGGSGIRLMYLPAPISILFTDNSPFNDLISKINTADMLDIYQPFKGKNIFFETSGLDFSGIVFIFGAFFGMLSGYTALRRIDYFKFLSSAKNCGKVFLFVLLSKFIILSLSFLFLMGGVLLWSCLNSLNILSLYLLYLILAFIGILLYFLSLGALAGALKNKHRRLIAFGSLFIIMVVFIPLISSKILYNRAFIDIESLFNFELENLKILMALEKRLDDKFGTVVAGKDIPPDEYKRWAKAALDKEFSLLRQRENRLKEKILKGIMKYQLLKSFLPITLWDSLINEISSKGRRSLIDFYSFSQTRKREFLYFYTERRFSKIDKSKPFKIESFVKKDENIYISKSRLPYGFGLGIGLTLLYTIGAFFFAYWLHLRRLKREENQGIEVDINFEEGKNTVFVLCKDEVIKSVIFNHHKQKDAACTDKINPADFKFNGIKPSDLLNHLSRVAGVDEKRARENLGIMGVDIDTVKTGLRVLRGNSHTAENEKSNELIKKIYVAVMAAMDRQLIVINDFFKRESRQYEGDCFKLLYSLIAAGKKIIYLSTEMYQTSENFDEKIKDNINDYGVWHIEDKDLIQITLR
jgi:hypothetical protein